MNVAEWEKANGYKESLHFCKTCENVEKGPVHSLPGVPAIGSCWYCLEKEKAGIPRGEETKMHDDATCNLHSAYHR